MRARVGLTGGIGAGKTEVARTFAREGAFVIDADALAREAIAGGSEGLRHIAARWPGVMRGDDLDRTALGAIVFADAEARAFVNGIVHPFVRERSRQLEASAPAEAIVVQDVPLLFETGLDAMCAATVLVVAPVESRIARVVQRSGFERADVERRMAAQIDPARARERATVVIENDAGLPELEVRARSAFAKVRADLLL